MRRSYVRRLPVSGAGRAGRSDGEPRGVSGELSTREMQGGSSGPSANK